jgi:hypothetical protein
MAHFAELDEQNVVTSVAVVSNEVLLVDGVEVEEKGIDLMESITGHRRWVQTSYSGRFRLNYAGIGFVWREDLQGFVPPCPGEGWTLDQTTATWVPLNEGA